MPLPYPLSRTAASLKRSVMRDLLALTARPGLISFAGGLPADELLPRDQIQTCIDAVLTRDGARALQYGPPYAPLKEQIALYMGSRGVACASDDIFITGGSQQGLEIAMRLLLDAGESVAVESFTFTGILQAVRGHGGIPRPVPVEPTTGIHLDDLDAALTQKPRAAIIIPDFHNPLGVSLSEHKRIRIADLIAEHGVPLIEDDPYSPLRYAGEHLKPIKAYDETDAVIYLGSFSKMLAPAMRLGWMIAPRGLLPKLTVLRESIDLESSQLIQRAVAEFMARGWLEPHLARLNAVNLARRDVMLAALERELGGLADWTVPQGGLFIWVTLHGDADTAALFHAALEQNVAFVPGHAFAAQDCTPNNSFRLNYSNATLERIEEGIRRLANVIRERSCIPEVITEHAHFLSTD
ncbi:MAG TPA: PLP-dependent aminotransferase family protein [Anaerolineales bacterium]|nr:PLP-dependent aminotransferase family protein [Anaerolineales bacterium]